MIALFQDPALLIAICASFVVGLLGYIIVRMWIKPIVRYNLIKRRLGGELTRYQDHLKSSREKTPPDHAILRSARKHAHDLNTCHSREIPYWYRLLLESRQTSPAEAEGMLTNINKIKNAEQVKNRIANARKAAGLKPYH